jgi:hypothetical protein
MNVRTDTRFRQFCTAIATIVWTGGGPMTAQDLQHQIDAETAHSDAAQETAEREAEDVATQDRFEADRQRERRRSEDATRQRQQAIRIGQMMFARFAPIAA